MIKKYPYHFITLLGLLLFVPFLGAVHLFDWDEINFAEAAREMILTHNYSRVQINFEPFWEKPPLFFWMQVACMKLFGVNEFAARLPNALCGIATLNLIYFYGQKFVNSKVAWWWVFLYIGSFTPHFYFKSGIIDPWFNLFIFLGIIQLFLGSNDIAHKNKRFIFSGLFLGLALLTKGPVAVLIVGLIGFVYLIQCKFKWYFNFTNLLLLIVFTLIIPLLWFMPDWIINGFWFTAEFLKYQVDLFLHPVASHGQPWFYHPVVLIIGCFPSAIIALPYILKSTPINPIPFLKWMKIMFWVVLILFSLVTTKIVHYSSLCYLPLTFIGALGLYHQNGVIKLWQKIAILFIGLLYSLFFIAIPMIGSFSSFKNKAISVIKDDFVNENILTSTHWLGWEWLLGIVFIIGLVALLFHKQGKSLAFRFLLLSNAIFIFVLSILIIPKIENHVQGSLINFYKSLANKDIYIETVGFKSYAHYYYTDKNKPKNTDLLLKETLRYLTNNGLSNKGELKETDRNNLNNFKKDFYLNGAIDKPVYLVYKVTNTQGMDTNKMFKLVFNKGGYRVFKRSN